MQQNIKDMEDMLKREKFLNQEDVLTRFAHRPRWHL